MKSKRSCDSTTREGEGKGMQALEIQRTMYRSSLREPRMTEIVVTTNTAVA